MPASIQFGFGDEDMWKKVWLFTRSCFHAEFLEFQSYSTNRNHFDIDSKQNSFWQNSSDSYEEIFRNDGKFLFWFWWKSDIWLVTKGWNFNLRVNENRVSTKMWKTQSDIWWVIKGWSINLRVIENRFSTKMWKTQSDIWWVTKGWNINLRVIENRVSKHSFYLHE